MLSEDQRMQMMYTGMVNCYCSERTLARSTSHMFTAVSLAGLPLMVAQQLPFALRCTIGFLGIALSVFWLLVNKRLRARINYWLNCLGRMESLDEALIVFRVFTGKDSEKITKPPTFYAVNLLPWMLGAMWTTAFTITLITYFFPLFLKGD